MERRYRGAHRPGIWARNHITIPGCKKNPDLDAAHEIDSANGARPRGPPAHSAGRAHLYLNIKILFPAAASFISNPFSSRNYLTAGATNNTPETTPSNTNLFYRIIFVECVTKRGYFNSDCLYLNVRAGLFTG